MLFVLAFLPVVIYIIVVYQIDKFALISVKRLLQLILCGMLTALVCYGLFRMTGQILSDKQSAYVNPVLEEFIKGIPLLILAIRKKIVFFIDSVICGAAVGGGFSILENLFYLLLIDGMGTGTVLFRGLEVALIHMGCSAVVAASLMIAVRRFNDSALKSHTFTLHFSLLLLSAPVLHLCHNMFHFNPLLQFVFVFAATGALLMWTYFYDVDMIYSWLDKGLDNHLKLLDSIKSGHLDDTPTGRFLESVKNAFPPEVYFDIICYVQLNVELSVAAKSRVMLREIGLDQELPMTDDQKESILSQIIEYRLLGKSLGKAAKMTIAPIMKNHPADLKALNDLKAECSKPSRHHY